MYQSKKERKMFCKKEEIAFDELIRKIISDPNSTSRILEKAPRSHDW